MRAEGRLAPRPANGLPGLANRFGGDRAGVDDHGIAQAGLGSAQAHDFRFVAVQPAAEGQNLDAGHTRALNRRAGTSPSKS